MPKRHGSELDQHSCVAHGRAVHRRAAHGNLHLHMCAALEISAVPPAHAGTLHRYATSWMIDRNTQARMPSVPIDQPSDGIATAGPSSAAKLALIACAPHGASGSSRRPYMRRLPADLAAQRPGPMRTNYSGHVLAGCSHRDGVESRANALQSFFVSWH